jgi:FtsH-binding integral membrane protein
MIIIGIIESEYHAIIFSLVGVLVCSGLIIYLQQGIFLFLFQPGHSSSIYYISQNDINEALIIIFSGILVFEIPNIVKLFSFIKIYRKFVF